VELKILASVLVVVLLQTPAAGVGRSGAAQVKPGQDWHVAQRVDARRIVVLFGGGQLWIPQRALEAMPVVAQTRTRTPGRLWALPPDRVKEIAGDAARPGDRWIVDAGRRGRFHVTVDQLVIGYKDCGEAWGVLATVAPDEAARFETVTEKYYVARLEREEEPAAVRTSLGPIAFQLDDARRTELAALLEQERVRTWADVKPDAEDSYSRAEKRGLKWPARWRSLDARLARGEGALTFDVQAFRLTPDGDPRLFVRARWSAAGYVAYALSAWVRMSNTLVAEDTNPWFSRAMRMGEFQQWPVTDRSLGLVLNVHDLDGDGRAEILFTTEGYENLSVDLLGYPQMTGPRKVTLVNYSDGC
jgi:hypothetical protein